jgi:hypothetical protein
VFTIGEDPQHAGVDQAIKSSAEVAIPIEVMRLD